MAFTLRRLAGSLKDDAQPKGISNNFVLHKLLCCLAADTNVLFSHDLINFGGSTMFSHFARNLAFGSRYIMIVVGVALSASSFVSGHDIALAQSKLIVQYTISAAGISIGKSELTAQITGSEYSASATGQASGFLSVLVKGEGTARVRGAIANGVLRPAQFTAAIKRDSENSEITMTIDGGSVAELSAQNAVLDADRVPVTDDHRKGIVDPLTAVLLLNGSPGTMSDGICQRTLPIFDGRRRYDLDLKFSRMDQAKTAKGYQGPVVVCAVKFKPIAGHHPTSTLVQYLAGGRDIELWFAPVKGTPLLAPIRLTTTNTIGNLVIEADQFEVL
jgi:Protein of unknown function (DUF3108)